MKKGFLSNSGFNLLVLNYRVFFYLL